ncbi:hypothetical protein [Aerococcus sp. UMB7834]|uniref:hypothetical protein n=1 Tax=Aerococcus sp. UMB7834 TaxID=3046342 RepID=UPI00254C9E6F|nr:hypothetical protein [Aerococcus sp. UMB7834]MDK6804316.1 hypothetical protein [Aerococcus sp. UMB7834]
MQVQVLLPAFIKKLKKLTECEKRLESIVEAMLSSLFLFVKKFELSGEVQRIKNIFACILHPKSFALARNACHKGGPF